jgi:hypothetical protein
VGQALRARPPPFSEVSAARLHSYTKEELGGNPAPPGAKRADRRRAGPSWLKSRAGRLRSGHGHAARIGAVVIHHVRSPSSFSPWARFVADAGTTRSWRATPLIWARAQDVVRSLVTRTRRFSGRARVRLSAGMAGRGHRVHAHVQHELAFVDCARAITGSARPRDFQTSNLDGVGRGEAGQGRPLQALG